MQLWNDQGSGEYRPHDIRDKDQREVDFLIVKDQKPWILIESQLSDNQRVSPALKYFQQQTGAPYAFQVVYNMEYVNQSCFQFHEPYIVPAKTFLSQLI